MIQPNHHFIELPGSYLFSEISKRVAHYKQNNPSASVISLGIGDVTQPLIPSVIEALHSAVDDQASQETFH
ncbi:MAG: LL-diaminopimelate aminotransferase, partial [Eubacteriales bacterium]|nr:LL-diaminopimelate aminotransferase [Eubacteriales bacterium]